MKIKKTYLIGALLLMLCLNIAYAQWTGPDPIYGKLKSVVKTGSAPIIVGSNTLYEYVVTLKKGDGTTVTITMWMTETQATFLEHDKNRWISLYYTVDAQGRNIYSHHYTHTPGGINPDYNELKHRLGVPCPPVIDPNNEPPGE